jgi:hypothetical protein
MRRDYVENDSALDVFRPAFGQIGLTYLFSQHDGRVAGFMARGIHHGVSLHDLKYDAAAAVGLEMSATLSAPAHDAPQDVSCQHQPSM